MDRKMGDNDIDRIHASGAGFAINRGALCPANLTQAMDLANLLARSDFVPASFNGKPGNVLAAISMGAEVGLGPMAALQNIAVINGRPSIWGDAALAVCQAHPMWGGIQEDVSDNGATCTVWRIERGRKSETKQTFTTEDAKRAGLLAKKGPWQQYPKRMLQMRARGFALRDKFPDALRGLSVREEAQDIVVDATPVEAREPQLDPQKGAAALAGRLNTTETQVEDESVAGVSHLSETAEKWIGHFNTADSTDELSAIQRDLDEVWNDMDAETKSAVGAASGAAAIRLTQ